MRSWANVGSPIVTKDGAAPSMVGLETTGGRTGFYRLIVTDTKVSLANEGQDVLGLGRCYQEHLAKQSDAGLKPAQIPAAFPSTPGLATLSYVPTMADYWVEWAKSPAQFNAGLPANDPNRRLTDFRLSWPEQSKFRNNGFVVSEARGSHSFTDLYYDIWTDDLPVFVTTDSILHAWHRTWITLLEEVEEIALRPRLGEVFDQTLDSLNAANVPAALRSGRAQAASYLTTAKQLFDYSVEAPGSLIGNYGSVINATGGPVNLSIFGSSRLMDWSQFGPRAHYQNSPTLENYFRSMMWASTVDMRLDQLAEGTNEPTELAVAVCLTLAMKEAGVLPLWQEMENTLRTFTGISDNLTPPQLLEILQAERLDSFAAFTSPSKLTDLLNRIKAGTAGVQQIIAHPFEAPIEEVMVVLPRSFSLFGQRFTTESWSLSQMVFDRIWRETSAPGDGLVRVRRRLPSSLDICFTALGNNTPAALLSQRMTATNGVKFRDGFDFSREMVALRQTIDEIPSSFWCSSLYGHHIETLRTLSRPYPTAAPEVFRTDAWKWKTVQTQLASWTELRHDNLLYAKQSYTPPVLCEYPAGYLDPVPVFYDNMNKLVLFAKKALEDLEVSGVAYKRAFEEFGWDPQFVETFDAGTRKAEWLRHLTNFANSMTTCRDLALTELSGQPMSPAQITFIKSLVHSTSVSYSSSRTHSGWYPQLYLQSVYAGNSDPHPSEIWDPLIADIHTDGASLPDADPGAVLYNATGNVGLLLIAIKDAQGKSRAYGGPSFLHYELTSPLGTRLNDQTWKGRVKLQQQPAPPDWTSSFLVPGPIVLPTGVQ